MTQETAIRLETEEREARPMIQKVPRELKDVKDAIGLGLFYLATGDRPKEIPKGEEASVRLVLSPKAQEYLDQVLPEFSSQRQAVIAALAVVAEKPVYVRATRI